MILHLKLLIMMQEMRFVKIKFHWTDDKTKDKNWYEQQCKDLNFDKRLINQELDLLFIGSTNCIFDDDFLGRLNSSPYKYRLKLPHMSYANFFTHPDAFDQT